MKASFCWIGKPFFIKKLAIKALHIPLIQIVGVEYGYRYGIEIFVSNLAAYLARDLMGNE